jgi:tetratricopeptide (TPR) repeat protein
MLRRSAIALLALALLPADRAFAVSEWYDHYLAARDRHIPARRWAECISELRLALKRRSEPALNARTYGVAFVDYLPYYHLGLCHLRSEDYGAAIEAFNRSERAGAVRKSPLHAELVRLRAEAQSAEAARLSRQARGEVDRLVQRARELARRGATEGALALLAQAEVLARELDSATLRSITAEQERLRATEEQVREAASRAQRIERRLQDGGRLLEEGRPTEALVAFNEVLELDARNARALEGRQTAQERILASTTRAARAQSFAEGQALFDAGQFEQALGPLTDAALDETNTQARELLGRAQRTVEGLRKQRELREEIERRTQEAERLFAAGRFPEAQVALEGVLRVDPGNARARERLQVAERRTGEALFARWLPNQEPTLTLFEPDGEQVEGRTFVLQGVATDDRGVQKVEFRVGGRLVEEITATPRFEGDEPPRTMPFVRPLPIEPGRNEIVVTVVDAGGLVRSQSLGLVRRLRFYETRLFLPAAAAGAVGLLGLGVAAQSLRRRRARRRRFNPYIAGAPVLDEHMFFGRERLTARMLSTLHRNSLLITGERRIGKTTFLHHLKGVLADDAGSDYRFFPVFVDLQGVSEQGFFHALMAEVLDGLGLSSEIRASLRFTPREEGYEARDFSHDLQRVIAELATRTDRKAKLILLIDEVDVLNEFSESVNQRLRGVFMRSFSDSLVAVMSGVGIRRTWKSEVSPWYNFFDEIVLPPFTREEAEALIRRPVAGVFRWEPEAVERVLELSRLRPYLIQRLCVLAVNHMLEHGRGTIRVGDVEAAHAVVEGEKGHEAVSGPVAAVPVAD